MKGLLIAIASSLIVAILSGLTFLAYTNHQAYYNLVPYLLGALFLYLIISISFYWGIVKACEILYEYDRMKSRVMQGLKQTSLMIIHFIVLFFSVVAF